MCERRSANLLVESNDFTKHRIYDKQMIWPALSRLSLLSFTVAQFTILSGLPTTLDLSTSVAHRCHGIYYHTAHRCVFKHGCGCTYVCVPVGIEMGLDRACLPNIILIYLI